MRRQCLTHQFGVWRCYIENALNNVYYNINNTYDRLQEEQEEQQSDYNRSYTVASHIAVTNLMGLLTQLLTFNQGDRL